ncbi:terpene cyclase/mutase family protein [bacterium]|nr:terpene cyclase/mutase family protein [candidate division CSSED10-310 bacterium]
MMTRMIRIVMASLMMLLVGVPSTPAAPPPPAAPMGADVQSLSIAQAGELIDSGETREMGIQGACDRIVDAMCVAACGGMGIPWPLPPCPAPDAVLGSTFGPCGMGLLYGYTSTGDPDHIMGVLEFGDFGLCYSYPTGEPRLATGTPFFMGFISDVMPMATQYRTHVETAFFQALDMGTYSPSLYTTTEYLTYIENGRSGNYINLRSYELVDLLKASYQMGTPAQFDEMACWMMQTAIDMLDDSASVNLYSTDIHGAACGVFSLSFANLDYDPQGGPWASQTSMWGVMEDLLQYQHPNGGFVWWTGLTPPFQEDDQSLQTTCYALMAMKALDPWYFSSQIAAAEAWIWSMQLQNGGFATYPGGTYENIQVDGEALWALLFRPDPWNDGDVDGNKMHTPQDSQWAFMIYLGSMAPTFHQYNSADCNANGTVTPADAQCIWKAYLGLGCACADPIILPPTCNETAAMVRPVQAEATGHLAAETMRYGASVTVTIRADQVGVDVDSLGFIIHVPPDWTMTGKEFGPVIRSWNRFGAEQNGRLITVGAWSLGNSLSSDDHVVTLTFTANSDPSVDAIQIANLMDDISGFSVSVR